MNKLTALITVATLALGAPAFAETAKEKAVRRQKEQAVERAKDRAKERVEAPSSGEPAPPKVPVEPVERDDDEGITDDEAGERTDREGRKHAKRTARIDQIEQHLTAQGVKNAGERVAKLRRLEDSRHERALAKIERKKNKLRGKDRAAEAKAEGKGKGKDKSARARA